MNPFKEHLAFFRQFRSRFETTGAIAPSSRFLAQAMTAPLARREGPTRVLEIGPGTGAVTRHIVKHIGPEDRFDLVEINEDFAQLLRAQFAEDSDHRPVADRSEVHCVPLQEFSADQPYDIIISGLPFNNFSPELVEEMLDHSLSLLAPGGELAFFEYMFVRPIRCKLPPRETRQRLSAIESIIQKRFDEYRVSTTWVFANMPPAWVQHLQKS